MISSNDYLGCDALSLCKGLRDKEFTAEELTMSAIHRAEAVNPIVNAIVTENYEKALTQAQHFDQNPDLLKLSPLAGLPFLIKDLSTVEGLTATFGSRLFKDYTATKSCLLYTSPSPRDS